MEQISTTAKLHESDLKFVQNLCTFLKKLEYDLKIQIQDVHPKRFIVHVKSPPKLDLDHLKQIDLLSNNIKTGYIDFSKDTMKLDMMKHGNKKKRVRDIDPVTIPKHYNLKNIDTHVKKIISYLVSMTEMEFTLDLKSNPLDYDIYITDIEDFYLKDILHIADKFTAFIQELKVDFPKKKLFLNVKKI